MKRVLPLLLVLMLPACAQRAKITPPDGHWWLTASGTERDGFLIGYDECSTSVLRQSGPVVSRSAFEDTITQYYTQNPRRANESVTSAITWQEAEWRRTGAYHFVHAKPENEYDGETWRQGFAYGGAQREGMIRGFLACQTAEHGIKVTVSVAELISRVSKWYGIDPRDEGVANEATVNDKLGAVILRAEKETAKP